MHEIMKICREVVKMNGVTQVKVFSNTSPKALEIEVNDFLWDMSDDLIKVDFIANIEGKVTEYVAFVKYYE